VEAFFAIALVIMVLVIGPIAVQLREGKRRDAAEAKYAGSGPRLRQDMIYGLIRVGMSEEQVIDSWGTPERRTFSQLKTKTKTILYYSNSNRVYLDNGYVTGWHTPTKPR
jgi:hypothetical protein